MQIMSSTFFTGFFISVHLQKKTPPVLTGSASLVSVSLFRWLHHVAPVLADRALVIFRQFVAVVFLKISADGADKAFLLGLYIGWHILEIVLSVLAQRT